MKIDVAQITDYDSLSMEEKVAALENFEYDDHSEAVENLGKYKEATDKATHEAADGKYQLHEYMLLIGSYTRYQPDRLPHRILHCHT